MQTTDSRAFTLTPHDLPAETDAIRDRIARMHATEDPRAAMEGELRQALPGLSDEEVAERVDAYKQATARYAEVRDDERPPRVILSEALDQSAAVLDGGQRRVLYLALIALGEAELETSRASAEGTAPQPLEAHVASVEQEFEALNEIELRDRACSYEGESALALAVAMRAARDASARGEDVPGAVRAVRDDAHERAIAACAWHIEASLGNLGEAFTDCDARVMTGLVNAAADEAQICDMVATGEMDEADAEERLERIALAFKIIMIEALTITLDTLTVLAVSHVIAGVLGASALALPLGFLAGVVAMCALHGVFQGLSIVTVEGAARLLGFAVELGGRLARYARVRGAALISAARERVADFVDA